MGDEYAPAALAAWGIPGVLYCVTSACVAPGGAELFTSATSELLARQGPSDTVLATPPNPPPLS